MAKRRKSVRRDQRRGRETNWLLIGGVALVAVIIVFALLIFNLQETPSQPVAAGDHGVLAQYCADNPDRCAVKGEANAPVTIVEVSDYGCPACQVFNQQTAGPLKQTFVETGQARFIILPFALRSQTAPSAEAALCAKEQELFFEYHDILMDNMRQPDAFAREGYLRMARQAGLDEAAFSECIDSRRYQQTVAQNVAAAQEAGLRATPSFFVNGELLEGAHPFATFQQRINSLLEG